MTKDLLTPGITARAAAIGRDDDVSVAALRDVVSAADLDLEWPMAEKTPPILDADASSADTSTDAVSLRDSPAQLLDVWRRKDLPAQPAPVLVFVRAAPGCTAAASGRARADVKARRTRLGVSGDRLPVAPHHRCRVHIPRQSRHRMGAGQRRQVRWRPQFRCGGRLFGGGTWPRWPGSPPTIPIPGKVPKAPTVRWTRWSGIYGRYDWEDAPLTTGSIRRFPGTDRGQTDDCRHPEVFHDACRSHA